MTKIQDRIDQFNRRHGCTAESKDIFGRSWDDVQAMQQGTYKPQTIDTSTPSKQPATKKDHELLSKHGVDGLEEMGFFGVLDRLNK